MSESKICVCEGYYEEEGVSGGVVRHSKENVWTDDDGKRCKYGYIFRGIISRLKSCIRKCCGKHGQSWCVLVSNRSKC